MGIFDRIAPKQTDAYWQQYQDHLEHIRTAPLDQIAQEIEDGEITGLHDRALKVFVVRLLREIEALKQGDPGESGTA